MNRSPDMRRLKNNQKSNHQERERLQSGHPKNMNNANVFILILKLHKNLILQSP